MKNIDKINDGNELFDFVFLVDLLYTKDEEEKQRLIRKALEKARELGVFEKFAKELASLREIQEKEEEDRQRRLMSGENTEIITDSRGNILKTIDNYLAILRTEDVFSSIRFNELSGRGEFEERAWTDKSKSQVLRYIESKYCLKSERDLEHALHLLWEERKYHPIREKIKSLTWDGKERIPHFLHKVMGAADNDYSSECSRLIFHCGIERVFSPGCKVDDIIVLQGEQGNGKSTVTSWLAMNDDWYGRISDIKGNIGMEQVQGKWICEISELLAVSGADKQEEAKQYLDRKSDNYRRPYAQFSEEIPRQCIFIGTTNLRQPFKDKTGNRRYYPVWCNIKPGELYEHEQAVKKYIEQCWAEAYNLRLRGEIRPSVKRELFEAVSEMQKKALEDDWRTGVIEDFLKTRTHTCIIEVWTEALGYSEKPSQRQSRELGIMLDSFEDWERGDGRMLFPQYKQQRFWQRKITCKTAKIDGEYEEIIDLYE